MAYAPVARVPRPDGMGLKKHGQAGGERSKLFGGRAARAASLKQA